MTDREWDPRAFAEANTRATEEHLRSLTIERAAEILEELLEAQSELTAVEGAPPPLENPPPESWPARLLGGSDDDNLPVPGAHGHRS